MRDLKRFVYDTIRSVWNRWQVFSTVILSGIICLLTAACASQPISQTAIVADPPQHSHTPPEIVPWEEQYARLRPKPEVFEESLSTEDSRPFDGDLEQTESKDSAGSLQVLVDIVAFPFRGVGWLLQQVF